MESERRILVVEDDEDFRDLLVDYLRASGRRVHPVSNGVEAIAALARADGAVGLVLLDLRMPVMDGFEVCRAVERLPDRSVPVVVMSAEQDVGSVGAYRCVVAMLQKPIELNRLDALVNAHLA